MLLDQIKFRKELKQINKPRTQLNPLDLGQKDALAVRINTIESLIATKKSHLNKAFFPHKDNRSKVIYQYDPIQQRQIITPAYRSKIGEPYQWRVDVMDTINQCMATTRSQIKKNGLSRLASDILSLSNAVVYATIEHELFYGFSNTGYQVHTHADWYSFGQTKTALLLQQLLNRYPANEVAID